jgi:hypothetical protein
MKDFSIPKSRGQFFPDQAVKTLKIVTFVHDKEGRFFRFMASSQQLSGISYIVQMAFRRDESGDDMSLSINRNGGFHEMLSDYFGSFRILMTCIWTCKPN